MYRFGFNGQHKDNEIAGIGNHNTALFWEYDTRLGRRWNIDPVVKPWESPFATFGGNPIRYNDVLGDDKGDPVLKDDAKGAKGTQAPNGGTRNGDGSITGGESFCKSCGARGEDTWGLPDEKPLGGGGEMNLMQAAAQDIGRNDANRQKVDDFNTFMQGFMFTGLTAPLLPVAGWELGAASAASDFAGQMYTGEGSLTERLKDWNPISTASAGLLKNPFLSSLPGGILDLSISATIDRTKPVYKSPLKLQTWKSIGLNTIGNMLGDHSGGLIRGGYGELGIKLSENGFGEFLGQQMGDVPSAIIDNATNE